MDSKYYLALKKRIVPQLRSNQAFYEEALARYVSEETVWIDAGCGRHILPVWRAEAEKELVAKARFALGCDVDHRSLHKHHSLRRLVVSDLAHLPLKANSVNLITCSMVVEHLKQPRKVFCEFSRILRLGGRVIVHTPNAYSHFVVGSRLVPMGIRRALVRALDGRKEEDVFPTCYRANTARKLQALMAEVGLYRENCRLLASEATLQGTHPLLAVPELFYIRLTLRPALKFLRASILATFVKTEGESS